MKTFDAKQELLTPQDMALQEAGTKLLLDSIETSRSFCKALISIALSAIPIYFALFQFNKPEDFAYLWFHLGPPVLYLLTSLTAMIGYLPVKGKVNLNNLTEIATHWERLVKRRTIFAYLSISLFSAATVFALFLIF